MRLLCSLCADSPRCVADVERRVASSFPAPINSWAVQEAQDALARAHAQKKHRPLVSGDRDRLSMPVAKIQTLLKVEKTLQCTALRYPMISLVLEN